MEKPGFSELIDGLVHQASLPMRWKILQSLPSTLELAKYNYQNSQVLQVLLSMDSASHEIEDEPETVAHELERLDSKLNLLLGMVGQLLGQTNEIPPSAPVSLGGDAMLFPLSPLQVKTLPTELPCLVSIELFLDLQFPTPLNLIGELRIAQEDESGTTVIASFQNSDPNVLELLEKYIFRQHRRMIAQTRHRS